MNSWERVWIALLCSLFVIVVVVFIVILSVNNDTRIENMSSDEKELVFKELLVKDLAVKEIVQSDILSGFVKLPKNSLPEFVFIGPGILSIPPIGFGAVEEIIWNYYKELKENGYNVYIINTSVKEDIVKLIQHIKPDFVHIQFDYFADLADICLQTAKVVAITSHFAYLEQPSKWDWYEKIFQTCINQLNVYHFVLSPEIGVLLQNYNVEKNRIIVTPNGADSTQFVSNLHPLYPDRTLCLAKIEFRKRQHLLQHNPTIWFAGNRSGEDFDYTNPRYIGEWKKDVLYSCLTHYSNLVLLSDAEADALVLKEALTAGLGIVISQFATANLDLSRKFICVITEEQMKNRDFVDFKIAENRAISNNCREEILQYAKNFHWKTLVPKYISVVENLIEEENNRIVRIAMCYSGQARDLRKTYQTHQKFLENFAPKNAQVDFFMHTWFDENAEGRFFSENFPDRGKFSSQEIEFAESMGWKIQKDSPIVFETDIKPDVRFPHPMQNVLSMFASMQRVNQMKKNQEHLNGFKYDIVVRLRTDLYFSSFPVKKCNNYNVKNCIFVQEKHCHLNYGINDQFAFGKSSEMDIYNDVFGKINYFVSSGCAANPECLCGFNLQHHGIQTDLIDFNFTYARRVFPE